MIRRAEAADWGELEANSEAAVKICGLWEAYGADQPFCRFWRWGQGGILASLEDAAVLYSGEEDDWEEMAAFLAMSPDIHSLRSDEETARRLGGKAGSAGRRRGCDEPCPYLCFGGAGSGRRRRIAAGIVSVVVRLLFRGPSVL